MSISDVNIKKSSIQLDAQIDTQFDQDPVKPKNNQLSYEFVTYFAVSVVALCVDTTALVFFTKITNFNPWLASSGAFIFGLLVNYWLSSIYVFKIKRNLKTFFEFSGVGLVGLAINSVGYVVLLTSGLYFLTSKAIIVVIVFFFNFFGRKYLLTK